MAIIRGPDGKPIGGDDEGTEATTRRVERRSIKDRVAPREEEIDPGSAGAASPPPAADPAPNSPAPSSPPPAASGGGAAASEPERSAAPAASDEPATQIVGGRRRAEEKREEPAAATPGSTNLKDPMEDPVVGWVVVIKGPGQGASLTLGYGMNSIGRAPTERISLDFGDNQVSRTQHATITYDPRGRKYFVAHGGGKNLTYMGEDPVLMPIELKGGEEIVIGDTTLKFVPFCGKDFDWRD
jgi:hypothetical protein